MRNLKCPEFELLMEELSISLSLEAMLEATGSPVDDPSMIVLVAQRGHF